jgi:hypothetical protein
VRQLLGRGVPPAALACVFFLAPWAWLKLAVLVVAVLALFAVARRGVLIEERPIGLLAGAAAWLLLVVSPYWMLAPTPPLRALALGLSAAIVWAWSRLAEAPVRVRPARGSVVWLGAALLLLLGLLAPGIGAPLEYRGDEDFHFAWPYGALRELVRLGDAHAAAAALAVAAAAGAIAYSRRLRRWIVPAALTLGPMALLLISMVAMPPARVLAKLVRYPLGGAWLSTAAALSPLHLLPAARYALYDESLYRLLPVAATLLIVAWVYRALDGGWTGALAALVIGTLPTVIYYSTTLYPDWPAAVLLTVALRGFDPAAMDLLRGRRRHRAALLAGAGGLLLKETALPLIVVAVGAYGLYAVARPGGSPRARIVGAARLALVVLTPVSVYLFWRVAAPWLAATFTAAPSPLATFGPVRPYAFGMSSLGNTALYTIAARAAAEQMGPALAVAALGVWSAARHPRRLAVWLLGAVGVFVFLAGDVLWVRATPQGMLPGFWGHSRFLLMLLPVVLNLILEGFRFLARRSRPALGLAACLLLAWNVGIRPLGWDGSRPPGWGDYVTDTSGERYPYDELYAWLARGGASGRLRVVGRDYAYRDDFYVARYRLPLTVEAPMFPVDRSAIPRADELATDPLPLSLLTALRDAEQASDAAQVVVHVHARVAPGSLPPAVGSLVRARTFRLGRQSLVVYVRAGLPEGSAPEREHGSAR